MSHHTFRGTPTRKMSNSIIALSNDSQKENIEDSTNQFINEKSQFKQEEQLQDSSNELDSMSELSNFVYKREYTGLAPQLTFQFEQDAFIKDTSLRYNPWSKTILGKSYQECRVKKRDRRQPGIIQSEEFQIWDKTGQAPGGLYGVIIIINVNCKQKLIFYKVIRNCRIGIIG